ncbi:DUF4129 domain-containing protein [Actinomyces sp. MRS3W]|uniref:DUF4129 domain-containing protein n=1 Tax=Actinomyces sp. MRS3W TaxID=2800796 RepID=UPI0028FD478C|nr:DUF4129 domain-containing protein [Actinomyces sp. MRS3W]MDU0349551.1 DUF4129 domain-containing protein [Actinomyces sp. MRS3W]
MMFTPLTVTAPAAALPGARAWGGLAQDVPATPDADAARDAAARELAKPVYQHGDSLWTRLWRWLAEHVDPHSTLPGVPVWVYVLIVTLLVIALLTMLIVLFTRVTWGRRVRRGSALLFDDDRDAAALTRAADAAAQQGDWATAVVERFRAIVRSLDERGAIEDYPGMTAHEASLLAARPLGELAAQMDDAARLFDAVRYGHINSTPAQDTWMREFADRVARASLVTEAPEQVRV